MILFIWCLIFYLYVILILEVLFGNYHFFFLDKVDFVYLVFNLCVLDKWI